MIKLPVNYLELSKPCDKGFVNARHIYTVRPLLYAFLRGVNHEVMPKVSM